MQKVTVGSRGKVQEKAAAPAANAAPQVILIDFSGIAFMMRCTSACIVKETTRFN